MRWVRTAIVLFAVVSLWGSTAYAARSTRRPTLWTTKEASKLLAPKPGAPVPGAWAYQVGSKTLAGDAAEALAIFTGLPPLVVAPSAQSARCHGSGKPRKKRFGAFKCTLTWTANGPHTTKVWLRPWAEVGAPTFCASTRILADCPPAPPRHPLRDDPRVCVLGPNPLGCILDAAELAARQLSDPPAGIACQAATVFVYRCSNGGVAGTVKFVRGKRAWKTTVTPGG